MELIEEIAKLTKDDNFLLCLSVKRDGNIETKCMTNSFAYADIPVASNDINANIGKLATQAAPPVPVSLQGEDSVTADDVVVYAEGEE